MNNLLRRGLSVEGVVTVGAIGLLGYLVAKDSKLAKEEVDKRTRGPELAGVGSGLGAMLGMKLFEKSLNQNAYKFLPSSGLFKALTISGALAAGTYAAGESMHNGNLGPEVIVPAAAKVGAVTLLTGIGYNKGLEYLEDQATNGFLKGIAETSRKEFMTRGGKLAAAVSNLNIGRRGIARILTAFTVVGAAKKIEAQSVRKAREKQTKNGSSENFMTPEEYGREMGVEQLRDKRREPLVNIKLTKEGFVDQHALAESLIK